MYIINGACQPIKVFIQSNDLDWIRCYPFTQSNKENYPTLLGNNFDVFLYPMKASIFLRLIRVSAFSHFCALSFC